MLGVVDEDRVLDRRGPPLAGIIGRNGAPTDHFAVGFDDQGRVGGPAVAQPGRPAFVGLLGQVPGSGAGPDIVVIDGVDRPDIGRQGGADTRFHGSK